MENRLTASPSEDLKKMGGVHKSSSRRWWTSVLSHHRTYRSVYGGSIK